MQIIFKLISVIGSWGIPCEIALRWMPLALTDDKSTLVQVMAWCHQATSHYLSQCWPRSLSPYGVTRPQWVNGHRCSEPISPVDLLHRAPQCGRGSNIILSFAQLNQPSGTICTTNLREKLPCQWNHVLCIIQLQGTANNRLKYQPCTTPHNLWSRFKYSFSMMNTDLVAPTSDGRQLFQIYFLKQRKH